MTRYLVRCENLPVGEVTANTVQAAVSEAYGLRKWSTRDAMSLVKLADGPGDIMYILFDTTNGRALARHKSYRALCALHYIQFANVDALILGVGANRVYSALSEDQLTNALHYAAVQVDPAAEYSDKVKALRETLEAAPWLLLPFTLEELEAQAFTIDPSESRPMAFVPGASAPQLLDTWTSEPQVNRKRVDSAFWVNFAAGEPSGQSARVALPEPSAGATVPKRKLPPISQQEDNTMASTKPAKTAAKKVAPAKKTAPAKKAAAAKKAAPANKAVGPAQEEKNGVKRPKPGGNTAQVWDACDALKTKLGTAPTFKQVDEYIEKKNADIPTATRRSNYAVWRKFHGISGRVG